MSKPSYAVQPGANAVIEIDGKKIAVGSAHFDGRQWGRWPASGDDRVRPAGGNDVSGESQAQAVSAKTLEAAKQASSAMEANDWRWLRSSGKPSGNAWNASPSLASNAAVRRTEIAVQLLGEMLRARVPSAEAEADFAVAIARLAIEGDGERMTKLAFFLADQVLAEEAAGKH